MFSWLLLAWFCWPFVEALIEWATEESEVYVGLGTQRSNHPNSSTH